MHSGKADVAEEEGHLSQGNQIPGALSGSTLLCNEELQLGKQTEHVHNFKTLRRSPT